MKKKGPWTVKNSTNIYTDEWLHVVKDFVIKPDGSKGSYSKVILTDAVLVAAVDEEKNIFLAKQYRYSVEQETYEVIAGGIEENEQRQSAAERELKEEAGIKAEKYTYLGKIDMDTSLIYCKIHLYVAQDLSFTQTDQDDTEQIKIVKVPFSKAIEMVMKNDITHAPSAVLLLKLQNYLQERK